MPTDKHESDPLHKRLRTGREHEKCDCGSWFSEVGDYCKDGGEELVRQTGNWRRLGRKHIGGLLVWFQIFREVVSQ